MAPQPEGLHVWQGQLGGEGVQLRGQQGLHVEVVDVGESVGGHHHLGRDGCRVDQGVEFWVYTGLMSASRRHVSIYNKGKGLTVLQENVA